MTSLASDDADESHISTTDGMTEYDNPLVARYASRQMVELWGPQRKHATWRRLWLALAEAEAELGLQAEDGSARIASGQLAELREHLDDIDFARASVHEKRLRHDVMAHIHTLGEVAPLSRDIVHLGATSCYVTDNADLILMREGLSLVRDRLVGVIDALATFAERWKDVPTLGYTHYQPAQLTTVGKRAALWCYDFVLDLEEIERRIVGLKFRGAKGTTGTQASFLALFHGDHDAVRRLDALVGSKMGFKAAYSVTGQTYTRKVDTQVLTALAGIAESAHKCATDLRLLAHEQEIDEPFEAEQVGSSAMAYKRNPMRCERVCSLSRFVMGLPAMAAQTTATQWLERTLDDSAARRLYIPQAYLGTDAVLRLMLNVASGLVVNEAVVARHAADALPYMATENLLMAAVAKGGNRQELHERIRRHSHAATAQIKAGAATNPLVALLRDDPAFAGVDLASELDPQRYVGRAPEQVTEFLTEVVAPIRARYPNRLGQTAGVTV
ncbi:MAG: adenylosuccinate lyase [Gemmataceae bacterium]